VIVAVSIHKDLARSQMGQFILQAIPWQPEWRDKLTKDRLICHAVVGETILAVRKMP